MEPAKFSVMFRKKSVRQIDRSLLVEPEMSPEDWREYEGGWRLFNERQFWHAHEAWENVWKRRPEESRIFFQGIIQLAAAFHLLLVKKRYEGMMRNLEKAEEKLKLFPAQFLGVDVEGLLRSIMRSREEVSRIGASSLHEFNVELLPIIVLKTPL